MIRVIYYIGVTMQTVSALALLAFFIGIPVVLMAAAWDAQKYNDRCYAIPAPKDGCEKAFLHPNFKTR